MNAYDTALTLLQMAKRQEDGTVDKSEQPLPAAGFWVGGVRPSLVYRHVAEVDRGDLAWFIGGTDCQYFGVWVDKEDGQIFFDAVDHMQTLEDALNIGRERGELAVWDIENSKEIRCEAGTGYQDPEAAV